MDIYFKTVSALLICSILALCLCSYGKEFSLLLSLAACVMGFFVFAEFLSPVISFVAGLKNITDSNNELFQILIKSTGICIVSELASMICTDAGNATLGKFLQILSSAVILWLSIPLLEQMFVMTQEILGGI